MGLLQNQFVSFKSIKMRVGLTKFSFRRAYLLTYNLQKIYIESFLQYPTGPISWIFLNSE